jgi:hypothetical protein
MPDLDMKMRENASPFNELFLKNGMRKGNSKRVMFILGFFVGKRSVPEY